MKRCGPQGAEKHTITFSFIQRGAQVGRTWCLHRGIELLWTNCANTVENRFFFVRMDSQEQRFLKLKRKICKVFITPPPKNAGIELNGLTQQENMMLIFSLVMSSSMSTIVVIRNMIMLFSWLRKLFLFMVCTLLLFPNFFLHTQYTEHTRSHNTRLIHRFIDDRQSCLTCQPFEKPIQFLSGQNHVSLLFSLAALSPPTHSHPLKCAP